MSSLISGCWENWDAVPNNKNPETCPHYENSDIPRTYLVCIDPFEVHLLTAEISYGNSRVYANAVITAYGMNLNHKKYSELGIRTYCATSNSKYFETTLNSFTDTDVKVRLGRFDNYSFTMLDEEHSGKERVWSHFSTSCESVSLEVYEERVKMFEIESEKRNRDFKSKYWWMFLI